eukprot:3986510-Pyramimonas_sp.AAC.1
MLKHLLDPDLESGRLQRRRGLYTVADDDGIHCLVESIWQQELQVVVRQLLRMIYELEVVVQLVALVRGHPAALEKDSGMVLLDAELLAVGDLLQVQHPHVVSCIVPPRGAFPLWPASLSGWI